ncbi:diguanylate cyclase [Marinobacter sp. S6332]|uniref:diguanylate cyclase domain-containing protein n=1 Tax=Marinobacter sp. S6332 TaxID=2926403 RepID=UPI001FF35899|nr:diguanylate cyclase [Marinobacter sp. S6332]MCK0162573.1 sensor domain-containing diguanylate cyclase [Marinobacter sp. S6332]
MLDSRSQHQGFIKSALATGLICTFIFTLVVYGVAQYRANQQVELLKAQENAKVQLTKWLLTQGFDYAASDLQAIAQLPVTRLYNRTRSPEYKRQLEKIFSVQLEQKPTYSQLRFLDSGGVELVRLDYMYGRSLVTQDHELQSKAGRYYFKNIRALADGEVYVSPLDLNVEKGLIDVPYLPTLRFGVPVLDQSTGKGGMVVLNVGGELLLDTFRLSMTNVYDAFLLNSEGHILHGPDSDQEWGFMFGLPPAFKREYPEAWEKIMKADKGNVYTPAGLFLFETVYPLERIGALPAVNAGEDKAESYYWKTVTFIPNNALPGLNFYRQPLLVVGYLGGLLLLLTLVFYLRFSQFKRKQLRREIAQQARRFGEISSVLGEGLIVMNRAGIVTYVNPEAEHILGWSAAELETQNGHQVFHVHAEGEAGCPILNVMKTGKIYRSKEDTFRRKDGAHISVSLNAAPLNDETGDEGVVVSFQDFTEIKDYQNKIHTLAYQDSLTGLPNRRVLEDRLQHAADMSERHGRLLALMFLDLDHFKEVNDRYGHDAGDLLLKEVAVRLIHCVRKTDTVIRMGGDEFIILLAEVSAPESVSLVAEKIIQTVGKPILLPEGEARVGVSIGIAVAYGKGFTSESIMQSADAAMYDAKRAGKNRFFIREHPPKASKNS